MVGVREENIQVLPNAINTSLYGMGPKNPALLDRYGLRGKTVLMTLAGSFQRKATRGLMKS